MTVVHANFSGSQSFADTRTPPSPAREEFRATKKVRHREAKSPPLDYRGHLLTGSERPSTLENLGHGHEFQLEPGDVVIDKSNSVPAISLSPGLKEKLTQNINFSVVVNLLGSPIGYTILCSKLRQMWDLRGAKVVDIGGEFFLVQFATVDVYQEAVLEGPWMLLGSYLQVQTWASAFRVNQSASLFMAVWIRIS